VDLGPGNVRVGAEYDGVRAEARKAAVELRRRRRVDLGDLLSLVFENSETLRSVAEEMLRAERIDDPRRIAAEVAAFAPLLSGPGQLAASLYLEIGDAAELSAMLAELEGLAASLYLEVGGTRVGAVVEPLHAEARAQPASYVTFPLSEADREAWRRGAPVTVGASHPRCQVAAELSADQRRAIGEDLGPG
jgi:hypothetical protein